MPTQQTKTFAANKGTTTRVRISSGAKSGSGGNHHGYVGRDGLYDYDGFLRFTANWSLVGAIVKAELVVFTDDGTGDMDLSLTDTPYVVIRDLGATFEESGTTAFSSGAYTNPAGRGSSYGFHPSRAANAANTFDITAIVKGWAPSTVAGGGKRTQYGIALHGNTSKTNNWAYWSENATDASVRPYILLTYEYGLTTPDAPTNLTPVGAQVALSDFQGDFSDIDADDLLTASRVQVYDGGHACTASTADLFTSTAHGLVAGDAIYLTAVTGGAGLATFTPYYVIASGLTVNAFKVSATRGGTAVNITTTLTAGTWSKLVYDQTLMVSNAERLNARFVHVPTTTHWLHTGVTYRWRATVTDQQGSVSAFTSLTSISVTDTAPNAPVLAPATGTYDTLDGISFALGTFTDPDVADTLLAYQIELSDVAEGNPSWDDPAHLFWQTGKVYVTSGATSVMTPYGGTSLAAGVYYWRARVWDNHDGVSDWSYATLTLSADFVAEPGDAPTSIQLRPRAPWRIVIKDMLQADGVTPTVGRGPGRVVAVLEGAKSVGASTVYNSPGEAHWTLPVDDPQISVVEPKLTHYSIQFRQGDGWREVFAGLVWDISATERDIVFFGLDYLGLYDFALDERYDPSNPDKAAEKGGSKYITTGKNDIGYIIHDQLQRAKDHANSPVGFITIAQSSAALTTLFGETMAVYSTYQPTLAFITGLLDSHRAGQGKRSRILVRQKTGGGYEVVLQDDPGVVRDNLLLRYGELVQGYTVEGFGQDWASSWAGIGRTREGIRVLYKNKQAPGIDEAIWGHYMKVSVVDGVTDENDLGRRVQQLATVAGKLGKRVGMGIRSGWLQPRDGYDLCDVFPISIEHGAVSTAAMGSGYWAALAIAWEAADNGQQQTILTFRPREDDTPPDVTGILALSPISPQAEWQFGWQPPNPLAATSKYWLDQNTGIVYERVAGVAVPITGTA